MKKIYTSFLLCLLCFSVKGFAQTDYEVIMGQIREENYSRITDIAALDNTVTDLLSNLNVDGSWPDINYADRSRTNWGPVTHLDRLLSMGYAYTIPASQYYQDITLHSSIESALTYWDTSDPKSDNWWFNEIASPQRLGLLLIILRNGATPINNTLENNLIVQMQRGNPTAQAGANKLDIALHFIYRGCLTADSAVLNLGINESFSPLSLTTSEGVQHDYSYQQHGSQLYISGYGTVFINTTVKVATYLAGTSYALSGSKLNILTDFVLNTYTNVIRGQYMDFSVTGRSISRKNNLLSSGFSGTLNKLKAIDPLHTAEYDQIIARLDGTEGPGFNVTPAHTQYWRSDYALYNNPGYSFSVRTSSTRTSKTENGNGENIKGYFLSDGATDIRVDGDEYYNIFPVWQWNKIPGVTAPELSTIPVRSQWQVPGTSIFTGGVSDSIYGTKVFALNEYGVQANKGWFFFGNEVVCLGAGINATASVPVLTTVNQTLLDGSITIGQNGSTTLLTQGAHSYNDVDWVLHDKVAYFFPDHGNLNITNQTQTGSWYNINTTETTESISKDVFTMWLDHGIQPVNNTYAYIVVPNTETATEVEAYNPNAISIIENNENIQAVRHEGLGILQIAFYTPGTYEHDSLKITVDKACVLMLKNVETSEVTVHVADPGQRQSLISIHGDFPGIENTRELVCEMPSGAYAGSSKQFLINENTPVYVPKPGITVTVNPQDDAYVRDGSYADVNYGTATALVVKQDGTSYARQSFLKFDLSNISGHVTEAKLKLYILSANTGVTSTQWELKYVSDDQWNEDTILWSNKPAGTEILASIQGQDQGYAEWDVSNKVMDELDNDGVLSLQVASTVAGSATDVVFYSKETAFTDLMPVLELTIDDSTVSEEMEPVADAYVRNGSYSGSNYGMATTLVVKNDATSYARESYLKFDLSTIEGDIVEATLSMSVLGANTDINTTSWNIMAVDDDTWDESTINWDTKPTPGNLVAGTQGTSVGPVTWDVTQQAISENATDKVLSLHLSSTFVGAKTDATFYAKETTDPALRPKLIVKVDKCSINPVDVVITATTDKKKNSNCTTLSVDVTGGSGNYSYQWDSGETTDAIQACVSEETTYTVTVTDDSGCSSVADIVVTPDKGSNKPDKVALCYKGRTISVAEPAVEQLLKNGAVLGKCDPGETPAAIGIAAYPNPTFDIVNIYIENKKEETQAQVLVFDINQQCILRKHINVLKGGNNFPVNLGNNGNGIYFIKVDGLMNGNESIKIIKK